MIDKVYIIIINFNGYQVTKECINSLFGLRRKNYHIILVDNCSTDDSYEKLRELYENNLAVTVLRTDSNEGFAAGNNYGIRYAIQLGAQNLLLLNNDTEVDSDFLDELLNGYDDNKIHTPRINYFFDKKTVWYAAGEIDFNKCIVKNGDPDLEKKVTFATGCCMLFSKKIIEQIGYLDENYFMYYEDVAYSLEARKAGIEIIYKPSAIVYHKVGVTSGGEKSELSIYYNNRNRLYIMKNYRFGLNCYLYTYLTRMVRVLKGVLKNDNDKVIIKAYLDYRKGKIGKR